MTEQLTQQELLAELRTIEGDVREISTSLWCLTVDDPDTATVESEEAGMTPTRKKIKDVYQILDKAAEALEALWQNDDEIN